MEHFCSQDTAKFKLRQPIPSCRRPWAELAVAAAAAVAARSMGAGAFLVVPRAAASSVLFRERWRVPFKGDFARKL
jgi:hypothetical protein